MKTLTLLITGLLSTLAFAQTLPNAVPPPAAEVQFLDANGQPLAGGLLYTYAAGTTTPQATYTDSSAGTPNSNPIVLDSAGRAQIWIGSNAYKFVLQDANMVQQWTEDNILDTTLYFVNYVKTIGTATLITYTPPSPFPNTPVTVSVALNRTLATDWNVQWFGAVCDGTTNDAQAIQNALNAAHANGGTVVFPNAICAVGSSATGKDAGVSSLLQKYSNVSMRGTAGIALKVGGNSCFSGLLLTAGNSSVMLLNGDVSDQFGSAIENICFIGPGSGTSSVGIYQGGDPSGVVAPANFLSPHNIYRNVLITSFGSGIKYGNETFQNDYFACMWINNGRGIYAPIGTTDTGGTEHFYGGIFAGNTVTGIDMGPMNVYLFSTQVEDNGDGMTVYGLGELFTYGVHWEANNSVIYSPPGSGSDPHISINGGDINSGAYCTRGAEIEVSGTNFVNINITNLSKGINGPDSCPLIDAQSISTISYSQINIFGMDNVSLGPLITAASSAMVPVLTVQTTGGECIHCDTSQTGGVASKGLLHPGIQINSDPSNPSGVYFGPQSAINSNSDWNVVRGTSGGVPYAIESGLTHIFNNAVELPGGILNSIYVTTPTSAEGDIAIGHTGAPSTSNVWYYHSVRANNLDYTLYGQDGTQTPTLMHYDYTNKMLDFADTYFEVSLVDGHIVTGGGSATSLSTTAVISGCTLTFTNGILTNKTGSC